MAEQTTRPRSWLLHGSIDFFGKSVPIDLPDTINIEDLKKWKPFVEWKQTLHQNLLLQGNIGHNFNQYPYSLRKIEIQSVDRFGPKIGFVKLKATIERDEPPAESREPKPKSAKSLPGIAFLRGDSVGILMILRPRDSSEERYVVLTEQPRVPAGSLAFLEIPAGMIEDDTFIGAAAKEVEEETGFKIPSDELVNMTELALKNSEHAETNLRKAMYPSPGGCDESIALFLWEKELDRQEIEDLRGKLTGLRKQDEMITLRVKPYEDLWKEGARDAKTLAAWALYEGLNRSEILEDYRIKKRDRMVSSHEDSREGSVKRLRTTAAK
ncbi:hypothetical protein N0V82_003592 [Gnomoniopsis sp. IMI 355080]|nr:hypothetical protein N0V82_003592 [Gnomoniopsis sp. IMI 355080]